MIAQQFTAGFALHDYLRPVGTLENDAVCFLMQSVPPSLRDGIGVVGLPSDKSLGYFQQSLQDKKSHFASNSSNWATSSATLKGRPWILL